MKQFLPRMRDLGKRITRAPHLLLGLDYDGTMTPIVNDPTLAHLSPEVRTAVRELAERDSISVAIISGRSLADLQERVAIVGITYAGNHGLEIRGPGFQFVEPAAAARVQDLKDLAIDLSHYLRHIPGVLVEDKGFSLSVHYRRVADDDNEEVMRTVFTHVNNALEQFHLTTGNKVYEIRPHLRWNKGSAIGWLKLQLGRPNLLVVYLGDDTTDEDAFHELRGDVTIKVGDSGSTAAQYRLRDPIEVEHFLRWIASLRDAA